MINEPFRVISKSMGLNFWLSFLVSAFKSLSSIMRGRRHFCFRPPRVAGNSSFYAFRNGSRCEDAESSAAPGTLLAVPMLRLRPQLLSQ